MIELLNIDCMEYMNGIPDNHFDLAIVDPPYGIRQDGHRENNRGKLAKSKKYHKALWDMPAPNREYFDELMRISNNQIVFGANHFIQSIPYNSSCWIVWDKDNGETNFADCELAWTSFETSVRKFKFRWSGMLQGNMKNKEIRIHPTQKPVALYKWLLSKYAKPGDKIFDSHGGSMSIAIACHDLGFDLTLCEIDEQYYQAGVERFNEHKKQLTLFHP